MLISGLCPFSILEGTLVRNKYTLLFKSLGLVKEMQIMQHTDTKILNNNVRKCKIQFSSENITTD